MTIPMQVESFYHAQCPWWYVSIAKELMDVTLRNTLTINGFVAAGEREAPAGYALVTTMPEFLAWLSDFHGSY